jgi:hypothetical protein
LTLFAAALLAVSQFVVAQKIAIVADKLYTTGSGSQGQVGVVLIDNGKVTAVRDGGSAPAGYTIMHAA